MKQKGNTPFYLHVSFYAPHSASDYQPEADRKPYENAALRCFPDEPEHRNRNHGQRNLQNNQTAKKGYSALITGMDRDIGRILRRLEERGLAGGYAGGVYGGSGLERGGTMAFGARGGDLAVHDDLGPPGAQSRLGGSDGSVQVGPGDQGGDQGGA